MQLNAAVADSCANQNTSPVLGLADQPGSTAAIHFNLGAEQAAAQRFSGGVEGFRAAAGAFGHGSLNEPFARLFNTRMHSIWRQI